MVVNTFAKLKINSELIQSVCSHYAHYGLITLVKDYYVSNLAIDDHGWLDGSGHMT
jgi:hypothetical protein